MSALLDAAKQAARDEADTLGAHVSPYVVGRIVEVAARVLGHPAPTEAPPIDVDGWETPHG